MKKLLALLMALIMMLSVVSTFALAMDNERKTPIVLLRGYGTSVLYDCTDVENPEMVWPIANVGKKLENIIKNYRLGSVLILGENCFMKALINVAVEQLFAPLALNPDGTSKNPNIKAYPYNINGYELDVEGDNASPMYYTYEYLKDHSEYSKVITKETLCDQFAAEVGADNIFIFNYDLRMGQVEYADAVDEFISDVLDYTGASKVDIFGTSHGGQQTASYLYFHGDKGVVRKAIMEAPAVGGTSLAGELFLKQEDITLPLSSIAYFLNDIDPQIIITISKYLTWGQKLLDNAVDYLVTKYLDDGFANVLSLWDFVPCDYYDEAMKHCLEVGTLDSEKNAALIAKTEKWHAAMADIKSGFDRAKAAGTECYIIANYGTPELLNQNSQSDLVIDIKNATGATAAPIGQKLGYDGPTVSSDGIVDTATCWLPDTTYIIKGGIHGKFEKDTYCMGLINDIFFSEEPVANSYEQYGTLNEEKQPSIIEKAFASIGDSLNRIMGVFKIGSR
ncbi:MAG: hypothetical protein MJ111_02510 [Clostridia bacterium]|nr:hypothetical protein [Clostridia bacterium]